MQHNILIILVFIDKDYWSFSVLSLSLGSGWLNELVLLGSRIT